MPTEEFDLDRPTAERLLDAAERLFCEHGYEGASLRSVTDLARANIASVNYHYGSKEGLLRAVVARAMEPVNAERDRRLTALYARTDKPSVAQIVRGFVEPAIDLDGRVRGTARPGVGRFIAGVLLDPNPKIRQLFADEVAPVEGRYLDALRQALPDQDPDRVLTGYTNMLGLLALQQAGTFAGLVLRPESNGSSSVPATADREYLISFLIAGLASG